jgi:AcrR family transcriptional regulator
MKRKNEINLLRTSRVIDIAHDLFMEKGFEAVGIRDICTIAEIKPVQLYRLGLDKKDLLAEVILRVNEDIIRKIKPFNPKEYTKLGAFDYLCSYLLFLYGEDIAIKSIRAEGAAFGWKWSAGYEQKIIVQVFELIKPIAEMLEHAGLADVQARCYAIWSLYYVGYRHAVMDGADAVACLAEIKPSLALLVKP